MKVLAIDSGNTRVKWGLWDGATWLRVGALGQDEVRDDPGRMSAVLAALPTPDRVAIANVAGARRALEAALDRVLARVAVPAVWARALPSQCGVVNSYEQPESLGADRWAALIGAWHRQHAACVVVCAGTATTVDMLSPAGQFRGGVILPGLQLMKRSLAENTARLPLAEGTYVDEPRNTADAIETGVLHAQAGAIMRMHARAAALDPERGAGCLLSGGAAARIAACLAIPHQVLDHLVLDGLVRVAGESLQ